MANELSGEERLIARYFRPLAKHPAALGLLDDAAALEPPAGCDLVLKTDGLIGGVHFFDGDPADAVAKKALRVNLSDLAAKGARPLGFLLALALPREIGPVWLEPFARGLGEDAELFSFPLFGGDTDSTPGPLTISVAALGAVPHGKMVRRSGARPEDRVVVTGTIGDAALGLLLRHDPTIAGRWGLNRAHQDYLKSRYLLPQPRQGRGRRGDCPLRQRARQGARLCAPFVQPFLGGFVSDGSMQLRQRAAALEINDRRGRAPQHLLAETRAVQQVT